jgi:hypothetical protein
LSELEGRLNRKNVPIEQAFFKVDLGVAGKRNKVREILIQALEEYKNNRGTNGKFLS